MDKKEAGRKGGLSRAKKYAEDKKNGIKRQTTKPKDPTKSHFYLNEQDRSYGKARE